MHKILLVRKAGGQINNMDKSLKKQKTSDEIKTSLSNVLNLATEPNYVLKQADKEIEGKSGESPADPKSYLFKALTLLEFDNGLLMTESLPEKYRVFSVDLSRQLQKEFTCLTASEKATAELVASNFVRTIWIQAKINSYLNLASEYLTDNGVKYFAILSKELDRANRHYLASLQTLKSLKQPAMSVNVKTQTAVIGQNQIVQSNNK